MNGQPPNEFVADLCAVLDFDIDVQSSTPCLGLLSLLEEGRHADLTFVVGDGAGVRMLAHRIIVASQSAYFDCLLYGSMKEAKEETVRLQDTPPEAFRLLLRYLYCGKLTIMDIQTSLELLCLADRYGFTVLRDALEAKLCAIVTLSTALPFLFYAQAANTLKLQQLCARFVDMNASRVLASPAMLDLPEEHFRMLISRDTFLVDEICVFEAVQLWMRHNKKSKAEASRLLECVRLSEIPQTLLLGDVQPSGLFPVSVLYTTLEAQKHGDVGRLSSPRGKKSLSPNLLKMKSTVLHSYTNCSAEAPPAPHTGSVCDIEFVSESLSAGDTSTSSSSVTFQFIDLYLINEITFEGYYLEPPILGTEEEKPFSYTVGVSRDSVEWTTVVDFSKLRCYSVQQLFFPKQAARFVRLVQTKSRGGFVVRFSSCSLIDVPAFEYRKNGILAPRAAIVPGCFQHRCHRPNCQRCFLTFNQPYSISSIRFKIEGLEGTGQVSVCVATQNKSKSYVEIAMRYHHDFSLPLEATFTEQAVSIVSISIWSLRDMQGEELPLEDIQFKVCNLSCNAALR